MPHFELNYQIELPQKEVWECLFTRLHEWWSPDFYTNAKTKRFVIEVQLGGKMYEDFGEGEGLIWGEVIGVDRPHSLQVRGMLSGEFGGPALSYEKFGLSELSGVTTLSYRAEFIGITTEKTLNSLQKGWEEIFSQHLIPFCQKCSS